MPGARAPQGPASLFSNTPSARPTVQNVDSAWPRAAAARQSLAGPAGWRWKVVMVPSNERQAAHLQRLQALRARGGRLPPEGLPDAHILDSWVRSAAAGLDFAGPLQVPVVSDADLARRRDDAALVRGLALAELETLAAQISGSNYLLALADHDGVVLDLLADNRFGSDRDPSPVLPGSLWREDLVGTNGLGTALATGRPTAVTGLEHFFLSLGDVSCTAAPIHDASGRIVAVLDATSAFESRQRHTLALVQMAATHIENGLLLHQLRGHWVLSLHPRAEFLGTLGAGLLAFDGQGLLRAANQRGRHLLQGLSTASGTPFEALFGERFDQALARLHSHDELRLVDVLGSALVARCVLLPAQQRPLFKPAVASGWLTEAPPAVSQPVRTGTRPPDRSGPAPARGQATAFIAGDPRLQAACRLAESAARMGVAVLIHGPTGSGKELMARHAHQASGRSGAFVPVNCGALPADLFEAELFGYVGGAFTGARRDGQPGLIASADRGTLLLDEVAELPMPLQAALLRFLDDQTVRPVGGTKTRQVDVLLLAATNADLEVAVAERRFRADLLYRLNTVRVDLPPLAQRQDFAEAARALLAGLAPAARISDQALARLAQQPWPGNFRELRSLLTRALLANPGHQLGLADVAALLPAGAPAAPPWSTSPGSAHAAPWPSPGPQSALPAGRPAGSALRQSTAETVLREWQRAGGSISQTARSLGVSRTTVYRHLRQAQDVSGQR